MSTDRPIPCPHDGDAEMCKLCWASDEDSTPYCNSEEYKRIRDNKLEQAIRLMEEGVK
jgi:hypothetical protein